MINVNAKKHQTRAFRCRARLFQTALAVILLLVAGNNSASASSPSWETELGWEAGSPSSHFYIHFTQIAPIIMPPNEFLSEETLIMRRRIMLFVGTYYVSFEGCDIRRIAWMILLAPAAFVCLSIRRKWLRRRAKAAD
jgi:hypothetical protein